MNITDLKNIISTGEGQFVEFKEQFSTSIAKEIVAFANASGGQILLGVNDQSKITGINSTNSLKSQVYDLANNCDPAIPITLTDVDNILVVTIQEGENKPYQCKSGFYSRIGANSQKLSRDEIFALGIKSGRLRFDEQICQDFDWVDFDEDKFNYYLKLARISNILPLKEILSNLRVLTKDGFTNAGILFFAKNPSKYIRSAQLRTVLFLGDDRVDILDKKEVDKGIIGNIEFAMTYLLEHVKIRYEIQKLARDEYPEYPEDALREAIVNAVIHRDYFSNGEVAIEKLKSKIIINNPGGLMFNKNKFGMTSIPRNRLMADLLSKSFYMEKVGTGIKRIQRDCAQNNNKIEFDFADDLFFVVFTSNDVLEKPKKTTQKTTQKTTKELILELLYANPKMTREDLSKQIEVSANAIKQHLATLQSENMLERIGGRKIGEWKVKQIIE